MNVGDLLKDLPSRNKNNFARIDLEGQHRFVCITDMKIRKVFFSVSLLSFHTFLVVSKSASLHPFLVNLSLPWGHLHYLFVIVTYSPATIECNGQNKRIKSPLTHNFLARKIFIYNIGIPNSYHLSQRSKFVYLW